MRCQAAHLFSSGESKPLNDHSQSAVVVAKQSQPDFSGAAL
jgi:hypothetical protein